MASLRSSEAEPPARLVDAVRDAARPLDAVGAERLLDFVGDARLVLIGEGSHGTHEFYAERARLTLRLVAERGFDAVAVEADWPDAWRVGRFVRGLGDDAFATDALAGFRRFPTWMWRNADMLDFVDALHAANAAREPARRVGVYGLDLYSRGASMAAVLAYLDRAEPEAGRRARDCYATADGCASPRRGLLADAGASAGCREAVVAMLAARGRACGVAGAEDDDDARFDAEQNARLVASAEAYHRATFARDASSWNLRDEHMFATLQAVERHVGARLGRAPRVVVWAHNSHLGDARATEMGWRDGELNLGQLVRQRDGRDAVLVGQTTHAGTVTAAHDWDAPAQRMEVTPARADSHEAVLHAAGVARGWLPLRDDARLRAALAEPRLERAIGVVYRPRTERWSHYFQARLAEQFDALIHVDTTRAVEPLERDSAPRDGDDPDTFPSGE